jgi:hypothetical protein
VLQRPWSKALGQNNAAIAAQLAAEQQRLRLSDPTSDGTTGNG